MDSTALLSLFGNGKVKKVFFTSVYASPRKSTIDGNWRDVPSGASAYYYTNTNVELTYSLSGFTNVNKMLPILFVKDIYISDTNNYSYYNRVSSYTLTEIKIREEHDTDDTGLFNFDLYVIEYE